MAVYLPAALLSFGQGILVTTLPLYAGTIDSSYGIISLIVGAAEAVAQSGRPVFVTGLSLPSICRPYIHNGTVQSIVLWNTRDLGYLTVYAGWLVANNKIAPGQTSVSAGRLGPLKIEGSQIVLGKPLLINQQNIDQLNF